ncbi:hypothetical protein [Streptomyces sp. NPDC057682]|uniref:hypothetical protein n=1 Tax=Streptomyces sp. NPDC057682 TaxID=3346210 RepID=UPI0036B810FF
MICPHCAASLTRRERTGNVCEHCRRRFALDPAVHGPGMTDVRVRAVVERATDRGRLTVTLGQLWYLARTQNHAWAGREASGVPGWVRALVALPVAGALFVCTAPADGPLAVAAAVAGCAVLVAAVALRHRPARPDVSRVVPSEDAFRALMKGAWTTTYGRLPKGVVDDALPDRKRSRTGGTGSVPRAVILCTDRVVARFLAVNRIPDRLNALLVEPGGRTRRAASPFPESAGILLKDALDALAPYSGGLPVVVLHDADPAGVLLAPMLRAAAPERVVVDAGLPVPDARTAPGAVRLFRRDDTVDPAVLSGLGGLAERDAAWLAEGFRSPVAAVPPRVLESVVTRAVEHAATAAVPATGAGRENGFLSWPEGPSAVRTPGRKGADGA